MPQKFNELIAYGKSFSGLTPELELCLQNVSTEIIPHLQKVTDNFYNQLITIPETAFFLQGRTATLKIAHLNWLTSLFISPIDAEFAAQMFKVGDIHVKVNLPVEFMAGGMTLITNELIHLAFELFGSEPEKCSKVIRAISAITGLSLMIMQKSYQESSLTEELEKFLRISGMSRTLFSNLANA